MCGRCRYLVWEYCTTGVSAVVLAAGKSERLRSLTAHRPKPVLPFVRRPLVEHGLDELLEAGISDITIVVGYGRSSIQSHFGPRYRDASLTYVRQSKQLGSVTFEEFADLESPQSRRSPTSRSRSHWSRRPSERSLRGSPKASYPPDCVRFWTRSGRPSTRRPFETPSTRTSSAAAARTPRSRSRARRRRRRARTTMPRDSPRVSPSTGRSRSLPRTCRQLPS